MIVDHIKNRELYYFLGEDFKTALEYFANYNENPQKDEDVYENGVLIRIRPTVTKKKQDCSFEAHKLYADIHFVAGGNEKIGYANVCELKEISYNEKEDSALLTGEGSDVLLKKGYFMITLPEDAHMPVIEYKKPERLIKLIAKIKVK